MRECVAMYLRLSQEDVDLKTNQAKDESNSISAQRALILENIESDPSISGIERMEFCDDGFSGTNFERPAFHDMIEKAKSGEISCIVVKDMSRFGRDYIEVGNYLEHIFPFMGIRFKSVNDHYDSDRLNGNTAGMDVAFQNLIYDYYSKDISKKVKSAMRAKQCSGGYVNCCPYGYKVHPEQKHKMVIDPEAAAVVRRIFDEALAGRSTSQIAKGLNADHIPTARVYKGIKKRPGSPKSDMWTHARILSMLTNIKYTGTMVNHTRESMTIRAKSQKRLPESEWIYTPNAHEPIVTKEEFIEAQAVIRKVRSYSRIASRGGFPFYCAHCGRKLQRTYGTDTHFSCVSAYEIGGDIPCNLVRFDKKDIEKVILEALKAQIAVMEIDVKNQTSTDQSAESQGISLRRHLQELSEEIAGADERKIKSYLDYREGRITKEKFLADRVRREKRLEDAKQELTETKAAYDTFLHNREEASQKKARIRKVSRLNDEKLKEKMYEAVERVYFSDATHIEIVWKFDDLFASI